MNQENDEFRLKLMCPPGSWKFFFTSNMTDSIVSSKHEIFKNAHQLIFTSVFDKNRPEVTTFEIEVNEFNSIILNKSIYPID